MPNRKTCTLDRNGGGADDSFSLEPAELAQLCDDAKTAWLSMGKVNYERTEAERGNVKFRRSLYIVKDIKKGEAFTDDHVRSIRPGNGILPKYLDDVIGSTATEDLIFGTPLRFEHFK